VVTLATGALDASIPKRAKSARLEYFDWMRGLACVLMFQTHCYDAWLSPAARDTKFFMWSQLLGTFPAPLFLFLTGISAMLMAKKVSAGGAPSLSARTVMKRGFEIWGLGMLLRVQEYLIAFPWAPWTDLLRVDVLNCIGVSLVLVGLGLYLSSTWQRMAALAAGASAAFSMLAPLIWTHHFRGLPWFIESYLNGVHNQGKPLPWLFPIFPWAAFTFAGALTGHLVLSDKAKKFPRIKVAIITTAGLLIAALGYSFQHLPVSLYPASLQDFWHTSPNFFLIRLGMLLVMLALCELRCLIRPIFSSRKALVLMGQHSLLVYWVHIEFVYGRLHILPRHGLSIAGATGGLLVITLSMLLLAYLRSRWSSTHRQIKTSRVTTAG
jgi:uncharacterized membrane protein